MINVSTTALLYFMILAIPAKSMAFFCEDPNNPGESVRIINSSRISNIGYAGNADDGRATIWWNPVVAKKIGPVLSEFFKYHECAHIQENYFNFKVNYIYPPLKESRADCLALIAMKSDSKLGRKRLEAILDGLDSLGTKSTNTHFSGKKRALIIIDDCMLQNNLHID